MNKRDDLLRRVVNANPHSNQEPIPDDIAKSRPPLTLLIDE